MKRITISKVLILLVSCSLVWNLIAVLYVWVDASYSLRSLWEQDPSRLEIWRYICLYSRYGHDPFGVPVTESGINIMLRSVFYNTIAYSLAAFSLLFPISVLMNYWIGKKVVRWQRLVQRCNLISIVGIISVPCVFLISILCNAYGHKSIGLVFAYSFIIIPVIPIIAWFPSSILLWNNQERKD